jgi:hypothetical protein
MWAFGLPIDQEVSLSKEGRFALIVTFRRLFAGDQSGQGSIWRRKIDRLLLDPTHSHGLCSSVRFDAFTKSTPRPLPFVTRRA